MKLKTVKPSKNFEDRTGDVLGAILARLPSAQSGLTDVEKQQYHNGASINDLYFLRAADNDYDLIPNQGAIYSGGKLYEEAKKRHILKQLDFLRRQSLNNQR